MDRNEEQPLVFLNKPSWVPQYFATFSGALSVFCAGTAMAWSSPAIPMLLNGVDGFKLTEDEASWACSLLAAGALVGALPAGPVADLIGRKRALLFQGFMFFLSWLMIYLAKTSHILYMGRFMSGIAVGASTSLTPLYISEIVEDYLKGSLGTFTQLMIVTGVFYVYLLGAFCSYKAMTLLCSAAPLLFLALFLSAPESPLFHLLRGMDKEAENSLFALRGSGRDVGDELRNMKRLIMSMRGQVGVAVRRKSTTWKAAGLCLALMVFQQLVGINFVIFNSTRVFESVGTGMDPSVATILLGGFQVIATIVTAALLASTERRVLLIVSSILMAASLLATGTYVNIKPDLPLHPLLPWFPLCFIILYVVSFSIGFGPIPYVLLGEILLPEIRPLVTGLSIALNWIAAFLVVETYPYLIQGLGTDRTFWLYGIIGLLITLFVVAFVVETKGKDVETIQEEIENGCPSGYQRI